MKSSNWILVIKMISVICFAFICSCTASKQMYAGTATFTEGDVRIVPPIKVKRGARGFRVDFHTDGGTEMVTIIDAEGKPFDLYMYHRLGREKDWGFYLNEYPGHEGSVRITKEAEFGRKILRGVLEWNKRTGKVLFK